MALGKPKGLLGLAIRMNPSKGGGSGSPPPMSEDEEETVPGGDAKMRAAEDALEAFKSDDAAALNDALSRHYRACAAGEGAEEAEEY